MAETFTPITTQEDLDAAIAAANAERYGDYDALKAREEAFAGSEQTIADLTAENKKLSAQNLRARIAHEEGLPYELASRLTGETEKDLRADAAVLKQLMSSSTPGSPMASADPAPAKDAGKNAYFRDLARKLTTRD